MSAEPKAAPRALPGHCYQALKTATRALVKACGGIEAASSLTRVSKSEVGRYQESCGAFMPIDVVADLEEATGKAFVTEQLARQAGCVLLPLAPRSADAAWAKRLSDIGAEMGDVFRRTGEALSNDGKIDSREAGALISEVNEAMQTLADMRGALEACVKEGAA